MALAIHVMTFTCTSSVFVLECTQPRRWIESNVGASMKSADRDGESPDGGRKRAQLGLGPGRR